MALLRRGIHRLGYVRVAVRDLRLLKSREFYTRELGLLETGVEPLRVMFRCWHEPFKFSLVVENREPEGLIEAGFHVRDDVDLDSFRSRIEAEGIEVEEAGPDAVLQGLGRSIAFTVPAGPRLRLFAQMAQIGYINGFDGPDWVAPKSLRGTAAPFNINHLAITSPDPATCVTFLTQKLGFLISEKIVDDDGGIVSALLFRMAKNVGGQEIAVYPGSDVYLHHVAFTKEDSSDIMLDGTYLRTDGVDMDLLGPLRQPYGDTFSMHFFDRCGIRLELCSGGRMTDVHPEFKPVIWSKDNLREALSYYDAALVPEEFFIPCLSPV
jgi:catechol 2,3-dioxygenase